MSSPQPSPPIKPEDLPAYVDLPGPTRICVDRLRDWHLPSIHRLVTEAEAAGNGIDMGEGFHFVQQNILNGHDPRHIGVVLTEATAMTSGSGHTSGDVIAALFHFPSGLSRSERPIFSGAFIIVNKDYRGMRLFSYIHNITMSIFSIQQFNGFLGRLTVIGDSVKSAVRDQWNFLGVIPWCTYLAGRGWAHDNIVHQLWRPVDETSQDYTLPALAEMETFAASLHMAQKPKLMSISLPILHHISLGRIRITSADISDVYQIQQIIRDAAMDGNGFGIDEFTMEAGIYNAKHIRNCSYWIARTERDGKVVAAILCGDTGLCRSHNHQQAGGVVIVLEPFQRQGLGSMLLELCASQASSQGYNAILTDLLACNTAGLGLVRKYGFLITGTLPKSCIVTKHGYMDAYVIWKTIE